MNTPHPQQRRAAALVAAIILLGVTGMAVGATVVAAGDDARTTTLRAQSLRAFYAAESGVELAIRALNADPNDPFTGPYTLPGQAIAEADPPFDTSAPSEAVIVGRAGLAERRVRIRVE